MSRIKALLVHAGVFSTTVKRLEEVVPDAAKAVERVKEDLIQETSLSSPLVGQEECMRLILLSALIFQ